MDHSTPNSVGLSLLVGKVTGQIERKMAYNKIAFKNLYKENLYSQFPQKNTI